MFFAKQEVTAVDHLSFSVEKGEIFGFLGPNGAGKTTTLNMILGIAVPCDGSIEIFGSKFKSGDVEPLERIGYLPEVSALPGYFSVFEILDFYARLFHLSEKVKNERIKHIIEMLGLWKERHTPLQNLSMGQRRLVDFMQALVNDPDLILLDEPTVYLDPVILERLRKILLELKNSGKTIIMSTHMLSEIGRLSDRIAIIDRGKLLKLGRKEEFIQNNSIETEFLRIIKHDDEPLD